MVTFNLQAPGFIETNANPTVLLSVSLPKITKRENQLPKAEYC